MRSIINQKIKFIFPKISDPWNRSSLNFDAN